MAVGRDLIVFLGAAAVIFVLSPVLALWAVISGLITMGVSTLVGTLAKWPYARTLLALGGGFVLGAVPYFALAGVLILTNPT